MTRNRRKRVAAQNRRYWSAYAQRLRLTRLVLGLSEVQAADDHGVSLATYRKWEAGGVQRQSCPGLEFARIHSISLDWLVAGEPAQLGAHLSINRGGKLAILPVSTKKERERRRAIVFAEAVR